MNVNIFAVRDNIDAFHTIRSLEKINIKAKAFPIVKVNFKNIPNYRIKYHFVVITSSKCIKPFLRYITLYKKAFKTIPKVFVIGAETGDKLKKKNFNQFFQAEGNSESLAKIIVSNTFLFDKGLWLCGKHRTEKIIKFLFCNKRFLKTKEVYEMFERGTISKHLFDTLYASENNFFIVNSSRNVDLLTRVLKKYNIFDNLNKKSVLVTMSKTIYDKAQSNGWIKKTIIAEASRKLFVEKFAELLRNQN